ncbi:MAG TPA: YqgE/AlgH family protein [Planctomycetaceae bacterium]|jgi:putative transcriptional regulator|nr:YqgE/AlgH family protein [Planctomycetaceae bacterium]
MPKSLRSHLLIAGRRLRDPNFYQSVVLILEHNTEGAMGVVLNSPTRTTVVEALESYANLEDRGDLIFKGGPVETQALFVLHGLSDLSTGDNEVLSGLFLGAGPDDFRNILNRLSGESNKARFRMFLGCAGWGPRQLEGELRRKDWMVIPARPDHVFPNDVYSLWDDAVGEYQRLNPVLPGGASRSQWN